VRLDGGDDVLHACLRARAFVRARLRVWVCAHVYMVNACMRA
jgi:hypothetical protein